MEKIMFVCTGNICRSAMAQHYMQSKVNKLNKTNEYLIESCGTSAVNGQAASKFSTEVMKELYDVDLNVHRASNMFYSNILDFDIILAMTNMHKQDVLRFYPKLKGKVYTLKEYINNNTKYLDIDDPWGLDKTVYIECSKEIVENVDKLVDKLTLGSAI